MERVLSNGLKMPVIGLGTWKSETSSVRKAVEFAIDVGYRHIDCAHLYRNENEVGEALEKKIKENVVKREDIFITSKLWNTFHRPCDVQKALERSLRHLRLEYIDLYLMHFPVAYQNREDGVIRPVDEDDNVLFDNETDYVTTWQAMEKLLETGKVKSIGVSNFNIYQLQRVLKEGSVPPVVNQVECHPYLCQEEIIKFCEGKNIVVVGFSPFGSPDRNWARPDEPKLLDEPGVKKIAERLHKTTAQVLLRFSLQRKVVVIPKSVTPSRIESNFEIFDFSLTDEDLRQIMGLNRNWRALVCEWDAKHKYYSFREEYTE